MPPAGSVWDITEYWSESRKFQLMPTCGGVGKYVQILIRYLNVFTKITSNSIRTTYDRKLNHNLPTLKVGDTHGFFAFQRGSIIPGEEEARGITPRA